MNALTGETGAVGAVGDAGEAARLAALKEYGIDAMRLDPGLDRVVRLAASLFEAPIAVVSLADENRQLLIARFGMEKSELPLAGSFCSHVVGGAGLLVVPDAACDPRFADSPMVRGHDLRFYAGAPLVSPSGHVVGALAVVDTERRLGLSEQDRRNLTDLAALALDKMEGLRLELARRAGRPRFETIAASSPDAIFCAGAAGEVTFWNQAAARLTGRDAAEVMGLGLDRLLPRRVLDSLHELITGDGPALDQRVMELDVARQRGGHVPVELSLWIWRDGKHPSFGATLRTVSARRADEERLCRLAHLDPLTGLPSRILLRNHIEQAINKHDSAAVIRIDLSGLKDVNDGFGHAVGDAVLVQAGRQLAGVLGPADVIARLSGDEFAVLVPGLDDAESAGRLADTLIERIAGIREIDGQPVSMGASGGIALFPAHGGSAEALLSGAELALFQAKAEGRHCRRFFTPGLRQAATAKRAYQNELWRAREQNEFELFYQPQIRLADGALVGAEALLRWRHPDKGLLAPGDFLAALQSGALAVPLGAWVIRAACQQAALWRAGGATDFHIAVNLFAAQFRAGDLASKVRAALAETGLPAAALELEITEDIILRHDEEILGPLRALHAEGVGITFDDYGTGYASFSVLKRFPVTRLKIDRSFVHGMCDSPQDSAIVRAILYLGRSFGLGVIAEGVETTEQSQLLRRKGCEQVQGFLTGRPMPAAALAQRFGLVATPNLMVCSAG